MRFKIRFNLRGKKRDRETQEGQMKKQLVNVNEELKKRKLTKKIFRDFYPVNPPFGYVGIEVDKRTGKFKYLCIEPTLSEDERKVLNELKQLLREETNAPLHVLKNDALLAEYLEKRTRETIKKFGLRIPEEAIAKITYYLKRDFLGYGKIDILIRDPNIEDISCNGANIPIFVWHRRFESLPTNIKFDTQEELDAFIVRLAYKTGHQISVSRPILEGTLPEGFRAHLTLNEVSKRGDTFTIRKIKADPYTIVDLIKFGTLSPQMAAYFWVLIENLRSIIIAGATASGKTSLLNAISTFIVPEMKVVTIEEVRELRLHDNWIPMVARPSLQPGVQEVTLFDLLKSSLRQRPDYIIVGEVRGEEAYTLFQSISVGHGGLCTIHAESIDAVLKRLQTTPMNIPLMLIPLMNVVVLISRTKVNGEIVRRVMDISEIVGVDEEKSQVILQKMYKWNRAEDNFTFCLDDPKKSAIFKKIAVLRHVSVESLVEEMQNREKVIRWMVHKNLRSYEVVSKIVGDYYLKPKEILNRVRLEL
ncbi:MAG TPA: hypothetical protein ENG66_02185 [Thermococcus sp.]|nr:hypothetical protein [Thermococcus sp.]